MKKIIIDDEEYMTPEDVFAAVGENSSSIDALVRFNIFPKPTKLSVRKLWKKSEINEFLEASRQSIVEPKS